MKKSNPFNSYDFARPLVLKNSVQDYAWGDFGQDAFIPRLLGLKAEEGKSYAELWIGANPKAPSRAVIRGEEVPLNDLIAMYPEELLGQDAKTEFGPKLPFLLKVLSARKALSIQTHPDKEHAFRLHSKDPEHYPDENHKPEIAIAINDLSALVSFRPYSEIKALLGSYPEIENLAGTGLTDDNSESGLRKFFTSLMSASANTERLLNTLSLIRKKIEKLHAPDEHEKLFIELSKEYNDVGLLTAFFLNLVRLKEGEGVFLPSGEPHAYLKGNIIECMANSDNVIRAGLTNKFSDAEALGEALSYRTGIPEKIVPEAGSNIVEYATEANEFSLYSIKLGQNEKFYGSILGAEIILVIEGRLSLFYSEGPAIELGRGESVFLPACLNHYSIKACEISHLFRTKIK